MEGELSVAKTEEKEVQKTNNFVEVANTILLSPNQRIDGLIPNATTFEEAGVRLQKSYREFYESSGMAASMAELKGKEGADMEALKIIAELASSGEGGWKATFPNLKTEGQGMDCTLAAATLHLALEDLGYQDVHSVLRPGHYVVARFTENAGVRIYDPATRITEKGITLGYSREFSDKEIVVTEIDESSGRKGKKIEVISDHLDDPGGFSEQGDDGKYRQDFYAHPSETVLDLTIALRNVDSLKQDAIANEDHRKETDTEPDVWHEQARQIIESNPKIKDFDYSELKSELGFFDPYDVVEPKTNNNEALVEVMTEVPLTEIRNEENDCGPLSLEMVMRADGKLEDPQLDELRTIARKESDQGTMPGNLVRGLVENGYQVRYSTAVDWARCTDPANTSEWDDVLKPLDMHFAEGGYLPRDKFADSAKWLSEGHPELTLERVKIGEAPSADVFAKALKEGSRVLVLVASSHWVVVTGVNKENIYFNDPAEKQDPSRKSMTKDEFTKWWLSGLGTPEMVIATPVSQTS